MCCPLRVLQLFLRLFPALSALLCGLAGPRPAWAEVCPIRVLGAPGSPFERAAQALDRARLGDCAQIDLVVADDGSARLTFATRDGRRAARALQRPEELAPALDALAVTGLDREPVQVAAASPTPAPPVPAHTPVTRKASEGARDVSARLELALGGRGGADGLLTPLLRASATVDVYAFELAVAGAWEAQYFDLQDGGSTRNQSAALVLSVSLGRRLAWGDVDLHAGARAALASVSPNTVEAMPGAPPTNNGGASFSQWRAGGYGAVAFPRTAALRFRVELSADAVLAQGFSTQPPLIPAWALSGLMGVEMVLR